MNTVRHWVASDNNGRDLFYFDLYTWNKESVNLYFESNLIFQGRHARLVDIIEVLVDRDFPLMKKDEVAAKLFEEIKKIDFYKEFYFHESALDKEGKLNLSAYRYISELNLKKMKACYLVPLSNHRNPELFMELKCHYYLHEEEIISESVRIDQGRFEGQLATDVLKQAYVDIYHPANLFYLHCREGGDKTFFILNGEKLLLAFEVK
ncbi:MAG TPA: hypothetical protein VN721_12310 [Flavipsychrobacter sp.]|nr:hypothetical protein [Flavipsychrobacter sp.]